MAASKSSALRVSATGQESLKRALASLAMPKAEPIYRRSLTQSAKNVQETTRRQYLSGQLLRRITGELWGSIVVNPAGLPRYVAIGSGLPQAGPLHFGWPARNQKPRPFLERGVKAALPRFPDIWVREMERQVERVR